MEEYRCEFCGCYMKHIDNSYLGEGGWVEDEGYVCNNTNCKINKPEETIAIMKPVSCGLTALILSDDIVLHKPINGVVTVLVHDNDNIELIDKK